MSHKLISEGDHLSKLSSLSFPYDHSTASIAEDIIVNIFSTRKLNLIEILEISRVTASEDKIKHVKSKLSEILKEIGQNEISHYIELLSNKNFQKIVSEDTSLFKLVYETFGEFKIKELEHSQYSLSGIITAWEKNEDLNRGDKGFLVTKLSFSDIDLYSERGKSDPISVDFDSKDIIKEKISYGLETRDSDLVGYICCKLYHWTFLALDKSSMQYRYIDSYGRNLDSIELKQALREMGFMEISKPLVVQQKDGISCGLWSVYNASYILENGINADLPTIETSDLEHKDLREKNSLLFHKEIFRELIGEDIAKPQHQEILDISSVVFDFPFTG